MFISSPAFCLYSHFICYFNSTQHKLSYLIHAYIHPAGWRRHVLAAQYLISFRFLPCWLGMWGSGLCLYLEAKVKSRWAFNTKPVTKGRRWRQRKTADENLPKSNHQAGQSFICLLTSSLVYQRCASERQRGPAAVEPSVVSHFWSAAGDQRVGEMEGNYRPKERRRRRRRRGAGLREFAGSLVYSVVVLTSGWTPAVGALAHHPCRCRGA